MSTPSESATPEGKNADRRMSLGKYVKRMSSVFRRDKSGKSSSESAVSVPQVRDEAVKEATTGQEAAPAVPSTTESSPPLTTVTKSAPVPTDTAAPKYIDRRALQQERARALFAKYGLTLESQDWIAVPASMPAVQRVEKSIRMRVHRSCHRCGTIYGSDKVCLQCEHKRCKKCPRYPKKKPIAVKETEQEKDTEEKLKKKRMLVVTTKAGNELSYQHPKQRIRRTCHKCDTLFVPPTATVCEQCQHVRCTRCPREPPKLQKWPAGYPGDMEADSDSEVEKQLEKFRRTWRKPRQRVRWGCEVCDSTFISGTPQCPGCGHERCEKCTRSPIKKTKKEENLDPILVAAVEAKLKALDVDSEAPLSGPEATRQ